MESHEWEHRASSSRVFTCRCCCCCCSSRAGVERTGKGGDMSAGESSTVEEEEEDPAQHLLVMVNGIVGKASNWRFAAEQFRDRWRGNVVVHCSTANSARSTFHGVDVMGKRLADDVQEVVKRRKGLKKISFVAHSLGGLVARYAISQLYEGEGDEGTIAGLEPMNFITLATPHLGSRGNRQLPFLFGSRALETLAPHLAHWFIGQTGKHLFLTDGDQSRLPLLQRMAMDSEHNFLSALRAFQDRVAYANVSYDHLVGWRTASIRRESEMPDIQLEPVSDKYPHVVRVEEAMAATESGAGSRLAAGGARNKKAAAQAMEEEMVAALSQMPWRRVDISFRSSSSPYQAHNAIQVKEAARHSHGADVICHVLDNFRL